MSRRERIEGPQIHPSGDPAQLRCCGRKPIRYKGGSWRSPEPQLFCPRCDRAYDLDDGEQIENWAWKNLGDRGFIRNTNRDTSQYVV